MSGEQELLSFVSEILNVSAISLSLETTYGSVPSWDSLAQLRMVMEVSAKFGIKIPFADVPRMTSLWEFYRRISGVPVRKAIAVDLDGTLWRGVVGEDGRDGIVPNLELQLKLKELKCRGVLLVALSKNNRADVSFSGMPLTEDDFVAMAINWNSKADNLVRIASELNLSPDAFVFVDDNPVERAEMRSRLDGVVVASFPPRLEAYFPERELTDEDRDKTEQYRAEARRRDFAVGRSEEDWLNGLDIKIDIRRLVEADIHRVAQLSEKANQFKLTANRLDAGMLRTVAEDPEHVFLTARASDRFGDQGLVAFAHACGDEIVDFTMSCRVMGRKIEDRLLERLLGELAARGVRRVKARWDRTGRNVPAERFYERVGFAVTEETSEGKRYERPIG